MTTQRNLEYHGTNQGIKEYDNLAQRKMISTINSLYDVLGCLASIIITGKLIFSDVCNIKLIWDEPVSRDVERRWKNWMYMLQQGKNSVVPRSVQTHARSHFKLY